MKANHNKNNFEESLFFHKRGVNIHLTIYSGKDTETGSYVAFIPSLSISGYGNTEEEAEIMLKESAKDYLNSLGDLTPKNRNIELVNNGWKKSQHKTKEFRPFVDSEGILRNFDFTGKLEKKSVEELIAA